MTKCRCANRWFGILLLFLFPPCSGRPVATHEANSVEPNSSEQVSSIEKQDGRKEAEMVAGKQPLTEEMAIEISRKALEQNGYDVSILVPVEYSSTFPAGQKERLFRRFEKKGEYPVAIGRTYWGFKGNHYWTYLVRIVPKGSGYTCEIYHTK